MPRFLDLECAACGERVIDLFVMRVPDSLIHIEKNDGTPCYGTLDQIFLPRTRDAQWSDRDAVVVFRKPDGTFSFPARNDIPTPPNCERVEMRSLREVERFEHQAGVRSEIAWFDKGSGRGFDQSDSSRSSLASYKERERRFMESWR